MGIKIPDYHAMQARLDVGRRCDGSLLLDGRTTNAAPVDREAKLHQDIMDWCDSQWPRWKFIHSRMDMKSTIGKGVNDFTVFGQFPLCILVECKKKDGKLDDDQRNWAHELKLLGWTVHVVRSIEEFKDIINTYKT